MRCIVFTLAPSVRHWDRLWSSVIKGRGILSVVLDLFIRVTRRAVDSRLRGNDGVVGLSCYHPHL